MSLNGIMGIGISSVGVEDQRKEIALAEKDAQGPVGVTRPDNLSAVQEDYVTLQSGAGQTVPVGAAGMEVSAKNGASDRGTVFRAIA
jgi:hypothetical protein